MKSALKYWLPLICPLLVLLLPADALFIPQLTLLEQRVIAIFVLATLCWVLEPIPIYATSVLIIVLELLLLSDGGLKPLVSGYPAGQLGG